MGLEKRKGKFYYYTKQWRAGTVTSVYEASGELAQIMAVLIADARASQQAQREALREEQARHAEQDRELLRMERMLEEIFTQVALENGYHKPKRQWRKKRSQKKRNGPASTN